MRNLKTAMWHYYNDWFFHFLVSRIVNKLFVLIAFLITMSFYAVITNNSLNGWSDYSILNFIICSMN